MLACNKQLSELILRNKSEWSKLENIRSDNRLNSLSEG